MTPRHKIAGLLLVMMLAACSPTVTPSPPPVIPSPSGRVTATLAPPPTPRPSFSASSVIDLADPTPKTLLAGGTQPSGVVLFAGAYVTVGTVVNDAYAEPGWYVAHHDPSRNRGVVWTSPDGRAWTLHDDIATFAHASLAGVVTDGKRLVAYGYYAQPVPGQDATSVGAAWSSIDGLHWTRAASPAPAIVAAGPNGFVGILVTEDAQPVIVKVRFAVSSDGLTWTPTSKTYDASVGEPTIGLANGVPNKAMAISASGTVLVIGTLNFGTGAFDGTQAAVYWMSPDGRTWGDPVTFLPAGASDAVVATGDTFFVKASGVADSSGTAYGSFWRVTPGGYMAGIQVPFGLDIPGSVVALDNVVLDGSTDDSGRPETWLSVDGGLTFASVPNVLFEFNDVAPMIGGLLVVGTRLVNDSGRVAPTVWLAQR